MSLLSLTTVESLIQHYGYAFFFPIAIFEGPIVTIIAAFLASLGYFNVFILFGFAVLADLVGDSLFYMVGYFGRRRFIEKGSFLWISKERVITIQNHFDTHTGKTLILGKITHSAGFLVLVASGFAHIDFKKFIWYNFIGTVPKSLVLVLVGYFFGSMYSTIDTYITYISFALMAVICLGVWWYIVYIQNKK